MAAARRAVRANERIVHRTECEGSSRRGGDVRAQGLKGAEPHRCAQRERSAVPVEIAFVEQAPRSREVRLLDKAPHRRNAFLRHIGLDVAVARLRMRGRDTEHDERADCRFADGCARGSLKRVGIKHDLVRGRGEKHRIGAVQSGLKCCQGQCGGRVPAAWLHQQHGAFAASAPKLVQAQKAVLLVDNRQQRTQAHAVAG